VGRGRCSGGRGAAVAGGLTLFAMANKPWLKVRIVREKYYLLTEKVQFINQANEPLDAGVGMVDAAAARASPPGTGPQRAPGTASSPVTSRRAPS